MRQYNKTKVIVLDDFGLRSYTHDEATALVDLRQTSPGKWLMRTLHGIRPFKSSDPDSERINWEDAGVHQNLTFPVQPDPISGQHCWHQKVRVEKPAAGDRYGDVFVDTGKSMEVYRKWMEKVRPAPGPGGLRRPLWLPRPYAPAKEAFQLKAPEMRPPE